MAGRMWSLGLRCLVCDMCHTLDEAQEMARELSAAFIVVVRESEGTVRIRTTDRERAQEKRVPINSVAEALHRLLRQQQPNEAAIDLAATSSFFMGQALQQHRPERQSTDVSTAGSGAGGGGVGGKVSSVQVNYRFPDKSKYTGTSRKKLEATMSGKITPLLSQLASGTVLEVLALSLPKLVVRAAAAFLELDGDEESFSRSVQALGERHPRYRKDLVTVCDVLHELKYEKDCSAFALYSLEDNCYSTLLLP